MVLVSVYPGPVDGFDLNAIVGGEKIVIGTLSMSQADTEVARHASVGCCVSVAQAKR